MVSASFNYSPYAVVDDGSCIIGGCIDSRHPAFDPTASYDDGSCPYLIEGCLDRAAANYRPAAVLPKVSDCKYNIAGCTNSRFLGFDPTATVMNVEYCGVAVREGCTDSRATSYRNDANTHLAAACAFFGCTDSSRPNYDATATREDGSCGRVYTGCMDPTATNYRSIATVPDYCAHPGCMDPTSYVYDAGATYDDGSCYTYVLGCTDSLAQNYRPRANERADCGYFGGCVRGVNGRDITPLGFCHDESPPPPPALPPAAPAPAPPAVPPHPPGWVRRTRQLEVEAATAGAMAAEAAEATGTTGATGAERRTRQLLHAGTPSASALAAYCVDTPAWSSASNNTCAEYLSFRWCAAGTYGPAWNRKWGAFELWARAGSIGAGAACCQCGGGSKRAGCQQFIALNWDSAALVDDGSCRYDFGGCTDAAASNFQQDATRDDGSCNYSPVVLGCTDPLAANFVGAANRDDHSCKYALTTPAECKDPNAKNYAPDAHGPGPGLGPLPFSGMAMSINRSAAAIDPKSGGSSTGGESGSVAAHRDEAARAASAARADAARSGAAWAQAAERAATPDPASRLLALGECVYPVLGCTDPFAPDFDSTAEKLNLCTYTWGQCKNNVEYCYNPFSWVNSDCGSCFTPIPGCIIADAPNYDPSATTDDGSCESPAQSGEQLTPTLTLTLTLTLNLILILTLTLTLTQPYP